MTDQGKNSAIKHDNQQVIRRLGALGVALALLVAWPANAHVQSYSYTRHAGGAGLYLPSANYTHNDGGGSTLINRFAVGTYRVIFDGTGTISADDDHVQVTTYGLTTNTCQIARWDTNIVDVECYDLAGSAADTNFTLLFVKTEPHTDEIAFAWANQPTNPGTYIPDPRYAFNPTGGNVHISRSGTGVYLVDFPGMGPIGVNGGHVQISGYGSTPVRCKVGSWSTQTVEVLCFDYAGNPVDSEFTVLFEKPAAGRDGLAFAWVDSAVSSSVPAPNYSYNAGGGAISSTRSGAGIYKVGFDSFDAVGFGEGNVQVTAYGGGSTYCNTSSWSSSNVTVRCYDNAGIPTDSLFTVRFWKVPKTPFNQEYAYAYADLPAAASYAPSVSESYVAGGGLITITRSSAGRYQVEWPGMSRIGSDRGIVLVSSRDPVTGHCVVSGWTTTLAYIHCFDNSGASADRAFNVLYMKPSQGTAGVAYAWAGSPATPSYPANPAFAHNPTGGAITIARTGTGNYTVEFVGYAAEPSVASHVQVSPYGESSKTCLVDRWSGDDVDVDCFDAAGAPADSAFTVLYLRPDEKRDGLAFVWANLPNVSAYSPFFEYTYNSGDGPVDLERVAVGAYTATFGGYELRGLDAEAGHVQLSVFHTGGNKCRITSGATNQARSLCTNTSGMATDTLYTALYLRPVHVPEPSGLYTLLSGIAGLAVLNRRRDSRHPQHPQGDW